MDSDQFDDPWTSDIVESYFDFPTERASAPSQPPVHRTPRRESSQQPSRSSLTAPPLEKTDSQWSPMSSGLVTPQDSITFWTQSPGRRRSGRFSIDSSGVFGQSNRWSLGTQLSNVSFPECIAFVDKLM